MLGILSDSHGNVEGVTAARRLFARHGATTLIHCGDIDTVEVVEALADLEVHWVVGNCDLDRHALSRAMHRCGHRFHGDGGELVSAGRRVAFTHGHRPAVLARLLESRPAYLVHGHTHERRDELVAGVRVLNPGALYRARPRTVLLLDPATDGAEWLEVPREP